MSTVRMCDYDTGKGGICGTIFSEREVGWSTGFLTVIAEDGKPLTESADFCPEHSGKPRARRSYPRFTATPTASMLPETTSPSTPPTAPDPETDDPWSRPS